MVEHYSFELVLLLCWMNVEIGFYRFFYWYSCYAGLLLGSRVSDILNRIKRLLGVDQMEVWHHIIHLQNLCFLLLFYKWNKWIHQQSINWVNNFHISLKIWNIRRYYFVIIYNCWYILCCFIVAILYVDDMSLRVHEVLHPNTYWDL